MQNALMELKEYEDLQQAILKGKGPVQATGTLDSQKVHLMYRLGQSFRWKLVVTYDETRAREIMRIIGILPSRFGFIRQRTCFFMLPIFTEIL